MIEKIKVFFCDIFSFSIYKKKNIYTENRDLCSKKSLWFCGYKFVGFQGKKTKKSNKGNFVFLGFHLFFFFYKITSEKKANSEKNEKFNLNS